jgi:hypothetical protein
LVPVRIMLLAVVGLSPIILSPLAAGDAARAQKPATTSTPQQQAPVGHRQPRSQDLPPTNSADDASKELDRKLDKALKGICRGS